MDDRFTLFSAVDGFVLMDLGSQMQACQSIQYSDIRATSFVKPNEVKPPHIETAKVAFRHEVL